MLDSGGDTESLYLTRKPGDLTLAELSAKKKPARRGFSDSRVTYIVAPIPGYFAEPSVTIHNRSSLRGIELWLCDATGAFGRKRKLV